jgi:hypothetical protein
VHRLAFGRRVLEEGAAVLVGTVGPVKECLPALEFGGPIRKQPTVAALHASSTVMSSSPEMALLIFFCSHDYDLAILAEELNALFQGARLGCPEIASSEGR